MFRRIVITLLALLFFNAVVIAGDGASSANSTMTCEDMENFLRTAKMGMPSNIPVGQTHPKRATLDDGRMRHDAEIQTIHASKTLSGGAERTQFKDWWEFNVAAYELAKMLQLNMVPPYAERELGDRPASLSWWIGDSMMEIERARKKLQPPDPDEWNKEVHTVQVFNQLIANMSGHLTNFLIDKDWRLWMIDFTQAFTTTREIPNRKSLVQCDRKLLANMRQLDRDGLTKRLGRYLTGKEIDALLARRDKIVKFFDEEIARKTEAAVVFDLPRVGQRCGEGL